MTQEKNNLIMFFKCDDSGRSAAGGQNPALRSADSLLVCGEQLRLKPCCGGHLLIPLLVGFTVCKNGFYELLAKILTRLCWTRKTYANDSSKKSSVLGFKRLNSLSRDKSLVNPSRLKSTVLNALTNSMTFQEWTPKLKCIPSYTSSGENTSVL